VKESLAGGLDVSEAPGDTSSTNGGNQAGFDKEYTVNITEAARKIARMTNAATRDRGLDSGFLVFGRDGSGGAYYTDNARPNMTGNVRVYLTGRHMTAIRAQEILDADRPAHTTEGF